MFKIVFLFLVLLPAYTLPQQDLMNRFMLAQNLEQSGQYEKAKQIFEELYQQQPSNFQFFDALNRVYLQLKEYDSSIKIIKQRLNSNQIDINLYGLLGKSYYLKGNEKEAFAVWDEGLKKFSGNHTSYRTIANYAIERRAFEKAVEYLNKGKEISDDQRLFSYDLANIYSLTMRYKDAAREYCSVIEMHPNQYQLIESKILSYINKPNALEQTIEVAEEYSKGDILSFDYLLARLLIEKGELDRAFEIYLEIDKKQNNLGADIYNFANFAYAEKEYELASKVFNEVIKRYPNSPVISSAKLGYAKTMEETLNLEFENKNSWKPFFTPDQVDSKKIENVAAAYIELVRLYPHTEVAGESLLRIGNLYFYKKQDPSSAENYFNSIIKDYHNSQFISDAYLGLAKINIQKDNLPAAEQNLIYIVRSSRIGEDQKNLARFDLAKVKFYTGDFNSAKTNLNEILNNLKDNIANDAIDLSLLLNTNMNDSSNLLIFASAEKLAAQGKYKEASNRFNEIASNNQNFVLQNRARLKIAEMELALDNLEESVSILLEISSETEKNIYADKALYLLGKIYQHGLNDNTKAVEMFESLLAKFPNSLYLDEAREEIIKIRDILKQES
jgi:tetratricopeptide (TPR) repeat protein